jgi:Holliday junction resolvase RusA-like endonuclease
MMQINFAVYGEPVPKGRPRFSTRGKFPVAYTPEKTKAYEFEVGMMALAAMGGLKPLEGALEAFIYNLSKLRMSFVKS